MHWCCWQRGLASDRVLCLQALTAGFFFNAAKLQRSGNYRTIKNKQTVHMHPQNGLSEVRTLVDNLSQCALML